MRALIDTDALLWNPSNMPPFSVRTILKAGSLVFGASAILLMAAPSLFLNLLALDGSSVDLIWSMRMIGLTLVALAGNMWMNSTNPDDRTVQKVAIFMAVAATGLGLYTLLVPTHLEPFAVLYALVGFGFGFAYISALILRKY